MGHSYHALVDSYEIGPDESTLVLLYKIEDQDDPAIVETAGDLIWGKSVISWNMETGSGTAVWQAFPGQDPGWDGAVHTVTFIYSSESDQEERTYGVIRRLERLQQRQLRYDLLLSDGACALSGEKMTAVLDVADIIRASEGGPEEFGNTMLLRTDLHRQYDQRLFGLSKSNGEVVNISPAVSKATATCWPMQPYQPEYYVG